jgi:hypothetical protein
MCQCAELFNIYNESIANPAAATYLEEKFYAHCKSIMSAYYGSSDPSTYSKGVYDICKELYDMDFEAYIERNSSARAKL